MRLFFHTLLVSLLLLSASSLVVGLSSPAHAFGPGGAGGFNSITRWTQQEMKKKNSTPQRRYVPRSTRKRYTPKATQRRYTPKATKPTRYSRTVKKPTARPKSDPLTAKIQQHLAKLGYHVGKADGLMGKRTAQAIRIYQKSQSMRVDGRVSKALLARLTAPPKPVVATQKSRPTPPVQPVTLAKVPVVSKPEIKRPEPTVVTSVTTIKATPAPKPIPVTMAKTHPDLKQAAPAMALPTVAVVSVPSPEPKHSESPAIPSQVVASTPAASEPIERNIARLDTPTAKPGTKKYGRYHALVIGIDRYEHLPNLKTANKDAAAVQKVLERKYGFQVRRLKNPNRQMILAALRLYRITLTPKDNLLIYYAGHGWLDREADSGYWMPKEANEEDDVDWVSLSRITSNIRAMKAKHVMIISDSCYSGKLTRGVQIRQKTPDYLERMAKTKTRVVMTSGGLEPVLDGGGNGHSVFAGALLRILRDNEEPVTDGLALFQSVRERVMWNADQKPEYADIRNAGHDGGDFLFVRKGL
ncbi:MAG: caspase family protein [Magnetococcales bacterium]|nr:caspase family protein [Magnetococcales bacterium]